MKMAKVSTKNDKIMSLTEENIQEFESRLRGEIILPESGSYDEARSVWNGLIDKRPGLIVRCGGVADVVASVKFARSYNIKIAVRGGGHNVAGPANQ